MIVVFQGVNSSYTENDVVALDVADEDNKSHFAAARAEIKMTSGTANGTTVKRINGNKRYRFHELRNFALGSPLL